MTICQEQKYHIFCYIQTLDKIKPSVAGATAKFSESTRTHYSKSQQSTQRISKIVLHAEENAKTSRTFAHAEISRVLAICITITHFHSSNFPRRVYNHAHIQTRERDNNITFGRGRDCHWLVGNIRRARHMVITLCRRACI